MKWKTAQHSSHLCSWLLFSPLSSILGATPDAEGPEPSFRPAAHTPPGESDTRPAAAPHQGHRCVLLCSPGVERDYEHLTKESVWGGAGGKTHSRTLSIRAGTQCQRRQELSSVKSVKSVLNSPYYATFLKDMVFLWGHQNRCGVGAKCVNFGEI